MRAGFLLDIRTVDLVGILANMRVGIVVGVVVAIVSGMRYDAFAADEVGSLCW